MLNRATWPLGVLLSLLILAVTLPTAPADAEGRFGIFATLPSFQERPKVDLQIDEMAVARSGSSLVVSLPVVNPGDGGVRVKWDFSIRNLKGVRLGGTSGRRNVKPGRHVIKARIDEVSPGRLQEEEIEYVLRYALRADGKRIKGRKSLFHLLPKPTLDLHAPKEILSGAVAKIPVIIRDALTRKPYANAKVRAVVSLDGKRKSTVTARTDKGGVALVEIPGLKRGALSIEAQGEVKGSSRSVAVGTSRVVDRKKVFLSTDKPLYQPGQTIHMRAVMFQMPANKPVRRQKTTVEVFDPKGNKVFKEQVRSNKFGIVHTAFTLANQITLGAYRIEMVAGDTTSSKTVKVERYVLPKFKVVVEPEKGYYAPDEVVTGKVMANYFFGKPVTGEVEMTFYDYKGTWKPVKVITAGLSKDGIYGFEFRLPNKLIGSPMAGGDATVLVKTVVTDSGGQKNEVATNLLVSANPVKVFLFPESGSIVPGVENRFYLVLSDPSGAPLAGDCTVKFRSSTGAESTVKARVDATGLGMLRFTPEGKVHWNKAFVEVTPDSGKVARSEVNLASMMGDARVLVRPSRSLARVGDTINLDVLAYGAVSDAYVDITRSNQTVWVGTIVMENGRGQVSIDLDETMKGTLAVSGYLLSERGEFVRDSRAVYVDSSSDLTVTAVMDKPQYKPAETAKIDFTVTRNDGEGAPSSLGIHIVDEAVFALSEAKPGLLKLYFALEEELLKPTYQIGRMFGQTLGALILHASTADPKDRGVLETTADATIAAQGDVAVSKQFVSSKSDLQGKVANRLQKFSAWLSKRLRRKLENMRKCGSRGWYEFDRAQVRYVQRKFQLDPWGTKYQVDAEEGSSWVQVYSYGPDAKPNTFDDFHIEMESSIICPDKRPRPRRFAVKMGMADMAAEGMAFGAGGRGVGMAGGIGAAPGAKGAVKKGKAVRVRQWFPETLLVENNLVTDSNGKASISVPLADSITSWRMTTVGSDLMGNIGGMTAGIKVFQDFFVDIDFPVFMTQNDQVTFPIVVYSYLDQPQQVEIEVKDGDWFELQGRSKLTLKLKAGEVTSVSIPVKVTKVGLHALTVYGRGSSGFADAVKRTVTVRPDGEEQTAVAGGKLGSGKGKGDQPQTIPVKFPRNTIEGSKQLVVQIMGGLTSHVVQGMDSMLKLPGG